MRYPRGTSIVLMAAVVLLLATSISSAGVVYVKWDSPGPTFDGASWDTAFHKVQDGLNASSSGDEVWVAKGTYVECITLKDGVGLYGGFLGTETLRDQRDFRTNETILDGNQQGSVVTSPEGATTTTVIDGFTIRNGRGTGTEAYTYTGGGIHLSFSSPTVSNNTITRNASPGGSAIYCRASSALISHNTIRGNNAREPIFCYATMPTIINNVITGNSGCGVHCESCYTHFPTIVNNTIAGNAGTGVYGTYSRPVILNNIIAFNADGIYVFNGPAVMRNNCVYGNGGRDYSNIPGIGDIRVDPLLASKEYGNVHIQPGSPCRDAGWTDAPSSTSRDIDGQPRVQGIAIDIGADESDGTTHPTGPYAVIRVSPSGNDENGGQSWESAKRTVQAGIDAASSLGGDVWVKAGAYNERVNLHAYVYLYGGFAGTEESSCERDWRDNQTTLDGGAGGPVVTITAGYEATALDGFTIRNGSASGIYCNNSSPRIANNTVTRNRASDGGAIYCHGGYPIITDNAIIGNTATLSGGGIYCYGSPIITRNVITENVSEGTESLTGGGGIYCSEHSPTITYNTIAGNTASSGGGIYSRSAPTIANNVITGNIAAGTASHFGGGGLCLLSYTSTITNNTITENVSTASGEYSGGGGIHCISSARISNNVVSFNSSGIFRSKEGGAPTLRSNCVYGNNSYDYSGLSKGAGDIHLDPLLEDRASGDYHLTSSSPCINTGWNEARNLQPTDLDGQPRIMDCIVDIGADEFPFGISLANTKPARDSARVWLNSAIVTAAFEGFFYIEAENRSMGIRVEKAGHGLKTGAKVNLTGALKTNVDGERFIEAETVTQTGTGSVAPLFINSRALGGGDWLYNSSTGAGQQGVVGGLGLNNIGMLVTTWGKLTYLGGAYGVGDAKIEAAKEMLDGIRTAYADTYVRVTGIVSCFKDADGLHPTVLATEIIPL